MLVWRPSYSRQENGVSLQKASKAQAHIDLKAELLDVSGINKASFDKGLIDHLVMKSETKSLIKNLVQAYITDNDKALSQGRKLYINHFDVHKRKEEANAESTWAADLIRGKGEGLTFLLHGKPGVGKTYTAGRSLTNPHK